MWCVATFGSRFRKAREDAGLSQEDIAAVCRNRKGEELTRAAVSYWEKDKERPSFENLVAAAKRLNVSIDYLVGRTPEVSGISAEAVKFAQQWEALPRDARESVSGYLRWARAMEGKKQIDYREIIKKLMKKPPMTAFDVTTTKRG